jgi:hypothetical protein
METEVAFTFLVAQQIRFLAKHLSKIQLLQAAEFMFQVQQSTYLTTWSQRIALLPKALEFG